MEKIFITGGSGFLGINLCRFLIKKKYEIIIYDIADFDYPDIIGSVKFIKGDIRNKKLLKKSMEGCKFVVHTAAALPLYKKDDIFSTDIDGTKNVVDAAIENGVERLIHISTTAVYGIPEHAPIYENDKIEGVGPYGKAKIKAEEICAKARENGLIVSIIRPKSFVGPERLGVMAIYYDWIRRGKNIPIIGDGKNRYQLLDVEDLCEAIFLCIIKPKENVNDIFNIGAKNFTTMEEDFGAIIKYAGLNKKIIKIPKRLAIMILKILETLKISPLYKWVYETAPHNSFVSIEKAEKMLEFKPKYSTKEALIRNYDWYIRHYKEFSEKTGVSHRVPWNQGILKFISWFF